ncbi:MAG: D-hexose-6-phosphate mutarotase [Verrucomicrobiales bacterium]|nr:D-hexose-6-phosphate mutarotase [Verrucomicrobiales bacterium]
MQIIAGPHGTPCLELTHASGASALVALHGGHLVSWKTPNSRERIYLSEKASYGDGTAIRGGVPVIFPQFSDRGPFARHGFARRMQWQPVAGGEPAKNLLEFRNSPETLSEWPHSFALTFGVELEEEAITLRLEVENTGETPFLFDAAFHTYLRVREIETLAVSGLGGLSFHNEVTKAADTDGNAVIRFGSAVDRTYSGVGGYSVGLHDLRDNLSLSCRGFSDTVVWNPGPDHGIGDLPEDGWREFVCIEAARIQASRPLLPSASWTGNQRIEVARP